MNKLICLLLVVGLILSLCGCSYDGIQEPVSFYYRNIENDYSSEHVVIAPELREASGHRHDPEYLLNLYLHGPSDPFLMSPFPEGTKLIKCKIQDNVLSVQLSNQISKMNDLDLTLACACIAKTCFSIADVSKVQITAGDPNHIDYVDIMISPDDILEIDNSAPIS